MFDLSLGEVALVVLVGVVFIGPKELPTVIRACAKVFAYMRGLARDVRQAVDDMAREVGVDDIKNTLQSDIKLIKGDDGKFYESYDVSHLSSLPVKDDDHGKS
jgi:Tat protein translocase TatB subunit